MTKSELLNALEHKPLKMECCKECIKKVKKDCEPNPLNCIDIQIMNREVINELSKESENNE